MAWAKAHRMFFHPITLSIAFLWLTLALLWIVVTHQHEIALSRISHTSLWMVRVVALLLSMGALFHTFHSHRLYVRRPPKKWDPFRHVRPTHMVFFLGYASALTFVCSGLLVYMLSELVLDFFTFALLGIIAMIIWILFWFRRYRDFDENRLCPGWKEED